MKLIKLLLVSAFSLTAGCTHGASSNAPDASPKNASELPIATPVGPAELNGLNAGTYPDITFPVSSIDGGVWTSTNVNPSGAWAVATGGASADGGMTQLTGEVTAGPGGGSQTATITPGTSGQIAMSNATPAFTWTTESGDCTISATGAQTCTKVNGVTIGGTPAAGNQPVATSSTSSTWSALNLAGGSGFVTGVLPAANQASQTLGGDLSGTTAAATVIGLRGDTLPAPTGTNTALEWSGSALQWVSPSSPISVSGTGLVHVTSGTVDSTAYLGTAGQFAVTNSGATGTAWATCSGDVSCSTSVPGDFTVNDIHGASVPAAGALTTGNGPYVSGVSALTYSALNLGGGSGWVTGTLPAANQAAQTMAGDVTGTTATSVVAQVHGATIPTAGALTTGNGPYVSGASALTYSALNLAGGPSWVTGDLPVTNIAAGSNGQVLTTVSGAPAWANALVGPVGGSMYVVSADNGNDSTCDGSWGCPYASITHANAVIAGLGSYAPTTGILATVIVLPGNYPEAFPADLAILPAVSYMGLDEAFTPTADIEVPLTLDARWSAGDGGTWANAVAQISNMNISAGVNMDVSHNGGAAIYFNHDYDASGTITLTGVGVTSGVINFYFRNSESGALVNATACQSRAQNSVWHNTITCNATTGVAGVGSCVWEGLFDTEDTVVMNGTSAEATLWMSSSPALLSLTLNGAFANVYRPNLAAIPHALTLSGGAAYPAYEGVMPLVNLQTGSIDGGVVTQIAGVPQWAAPAAGLVVGNYAEGFENTSFTASPNTVYFLDARSNAITVQFGALAAGQWIGLVDQYTAFATHNVTVLPSAGDLMVNPSTLGYASSVTLATGGQSEAWVSDGTGFEELQYSNGGGSSSSAIGGVTFSGPPAVGNQPIATSSTAASWSALNLAGGSAYVTGVLPAVNQAFQTLAGDAVGVANANVVSSVGGGQVAFNGGSLETWNVAASPNITQVSDGSHVQGQSFTITPQWSTVAGNQGSGNIIFPFEAATGIATESHLQTTRGGSISGGVVSGGVLTTQLGGLSDIPGYAGLFLGNVATTSQNAAISNQGADTWVNALNGEAVILSINASAQSAQTATAFTAGPNLVVASDGSSSLGGCVGCLEINKANTVPTSVSTKGVLLSEESDGLHAYNFGSGFSDQIISPAWQSASFSGSQSGFDYLFSNTATDTTSATLVTILTIPLPNSGTSVDCEVRAVARLRGSTPSSAAFGYQDLFINTGGTVTGQTGGANNIYSANLGLTTGAVSFVISGTNILVQVQDLLSANVDWTAHASCHYS